MPTEDKMKRWYIKLLAITLFIFSMVAIASAGSWATVKIEEMPKQIEAGQTALITFTVWQHDQRLVHEIGWGADGTKAIEPIVHLENVTTGETLQFTAEKSKQVGYYTVALQLPSEGEWRWSIEPFPLQKASSLPNLSVLPAQTTNLASDGSETAVTNVLATPFVRIIAIVSLLLLIAGFLFFLKRQSLRPIPQ